MPDLAGVAGIASVDAPVTHRLEARYLDTADLALVRAGVTLRRRTGGDDEGWHLKLPAAGGRWEVHAPLGRGERPPVRLTDPVLAHSHGAPLEPIARIVTERTTHVARDAAGTPVVLLVDDHVVGTAIEGTAPGAPLTWREWEVELAHAQDAEIDAARLDAVGEALTAAGATPAEVGRKIAVVLGDRVPAPVERPDHPLLAHLHDLVGTVVGHDAAARRGDEEAVHRARLATRRLRNLLATFRPLFDREVTDPLREELSWFGGLLGAVRDPQVSAAVVQRWLDDQPRELVVGPVRRRAVRLYRDRAQVAARELARAMREPRYLALLAALDRLVEETPWADGSMGPEGAPGRKALRRTARRRVRQDWKRLRDRHRAGEDPHEVRKAAKRLRHGCEVARLVVGADADPLRKAAKQLASVFGEREDAVALRDDLLLVAAGAHAAGESTFTYGRLHAQAEVLTTLLAAGAETLWPRLANSKLRRWLR